MSSKCASAVMAFFFEYDTVKLVHIKSKKIGLISRSVQLLVIAYVIGWVMVWNKGYQHSDVGVSGVTTKVKGVEYTNYSALAPEIGSRIWDVGDYVIPAQQNGAFFVMTNMIVTRNQSQGVCEEDASVSEARCSDDADCPAGRPLLVGNGAFTGRCVNSTSESGAAKAMKVCELFAWCPVEKSKPSLSHAALLGTRNFTVLIKNDVYFPYYNRHVSNIVKDVNRAYLRSCVNSALADPLCPVFRLGNIVDDLGGENYSDLAQTGAVVLIRIDWNCNLDLDDDRCRPKYVFTRMDAERGGAGVLKGYNFRTAHHYEVDGVARRTLVKAYGILFVVVVNAKAGAFNVIPLLLNLGSGLALLGIAIVICDLVMLLFHRRRRHFKNAVYELVKRTTSIKRECNNQGKNGARTLAITPQAEEPAPPTAPA